jgi:hypothetical protein
MACDLSLGRVEPCKDVVGGLDAVYFINFDDAPVGDITYDVTNTDVIETLNSTPSTIDAYKYELKGNSSFEQTITSSRENGTTFFEQVLNLTLKKQDLATHKEVKLLAFGRPHVIVKDHNNNYFYCGLEWGADVTGGTISTGAAMGDLSGYTLTLTAQERIPANFFEATDDAGLATAGINVITG